MCLVQMGVAVLVSSYLYQNRSDTEGEDEVRGVTLGGGWGCCSEFNFIGLTK